MSRVRSIRTDVLDAPGKVVCVGSPIEGFGFPVPRVDLVTDRHFERTHQSEHAQADLLRRDLGEEPPDLAQPFRSNRREVGVAPRPTREPMLYRRCLLGRVVVHHQMHLGARLTGLANDPIHAVESGRSLCRELKPVAVWILRYT